MQMRRQGVLFLATGGYLGKVPAAPGTFGSLLGLPLAWLFSRLPAAGEIAAVILFIAGAMWVSAEAERLLGRTDPGAIVIDEVAGMLVTFLWIPMTIGSAAIGFVAFRVLDITKPFPIRLLERKLSGGVAVVADDLAAGFAANLVLRLLPLMGLG
ncbi:MAG: phosphatidylglycerophosphatase A [Desulfobacterales bacterium]|jgi:phosphatidylglycerophosphatase A